MRRDMSNATTANKINGMKGESGILHLDGFNLANGCVSDYMHGIFLRAVYKLLDLWFSLSSTNERCFKGKHIKEVARRVGEMAAPYFIEHLPHRDFDTQYTHLKATELQALMLYYATPCLARILPKEYLSHFELLSQCVFLLLGDNVTQ
ncbi:unnamed protein product, partial [Owenia fusiformis]